MVIISGGNDEGGEDNGDDDDDGTNQVMDRWWYYIHTYSKVAERVGVKHIQNNRIGLKWFDVN